MKKYIFIVFMILVFFNLIMSSISYGFTYNYSCGIYQTELVHNGGEACFACAGVGVTFTIKIVEAFDNYSSAQTYINNLFTQSPYNSGTGWDAKTGPSNQVTSSWNLNCRTGGLEMFSDTMWDSYGFAVWNCNGSSKIGYRVHALYPASSWVDINNDCINDTGVDTDGDGIIDINDPYPDDDVDCRFRIVAYEYCDSNIVGMTIETNFGDKVDMYESGDCQGDLSISLIMYSGIKYDYNCDQLGSGDFAGFSIGPGQGGEMEKQELGYNTDKSINIDAEDQGDGDTGTSSETQTELLAKTVNNLDKVLAEVQKSNDLSLGTQKIINNTNTSNTLLIKEKLQEGNESNATGLASVKTSTDNVKTSTDNIYNAVEENNAGNTVDTPTQTDISSIASQSTTLPTDHYEENELPEENLISTIFENFLENNPLNDLFDGILITTATPTCSFVDNLSIGESEQEIEFDLCPYEDIFVIMGDILYFISILTFLYIVFRV